jgi:hypothetical protein
MLPFVKVEFVLRNPIDWEGYVTGSIEVSPYNESLEHVQSPHK